MKSFLGWKKWKNHNIFATFHKYNAHFEKKFHAFSVDVPLFKIEVKSFFGSFLCYFLILSIFPYILTLFWLMWVNDCSQIYPSLWLWHVIVCAHHNNNWHHYILSTTTTTLTLWLHFCATSLLPCYCCWLVRLLWCLWCDWIFVGKFAEMFVLCT